MPITISAPTAAPPQRPSSPSDTEEMDLDLPPSTTLLTPGTPLTSDAQFMRGHGTFLSTESGITSSLLGTLLKTNKLLSIAPLSSRYTPSVGDLVVGRVVEVQSKRWKLDICAAVLANLPLSAINLPGGALRRRTGVDELAMRAYAEEGDVLLAEVQGLFGDGSAALHARSLAYGRLRNGLLVPVGRRGVVRRSNRHVFALGTRAGEVEVLVGVNGYVWVAARGETGKGMKMGQGMGVGGEMGEDEARAMYSVQNDEIAPQMRREIGRVASCVKALAAYGIRVDEDAIRRCYEAAVEDEMSAEVDGMAPDEGRFLGGERGRAVVQQAMATKG